MQSGSLSTTSDRKLKHFQQNLYILGVSVELGSRSVSFDYTVMGLPENVVTALEQTYNNNHLKEQAKFKSGTIPIFKTLNEAGNELERRRRRIQSYMLYSKPYWFVVESDLVAVQQEILETESLCDQLKLQVLANYDQDYDDYKNSIRGILSKAQLSWDDCNKALPAFMAKFPSREKVAESINFVVTWGGRIPSLQEQFERETELKELLNRDAAADAEAQILQAKTEMELRSICHMRESMKTAISAARDEVEQLVGSILDLMSKYNLNNSLTDRQQGAINDQLQRLQSLCAVSGNFHDLKDQLASVVENSSRDRGIKLQAGINKLRKQMEAELSEVRLGAQAIEFDAQLKRILGQIQSARSSNDSASLAQRTAEFQRLKAEVSVFSGILSEQSQKLLSNIDDIAIAISGEISPAKALTKETAQVSDTVSDGLVVVDPTIGF